MLVEDALRIPGLRAVCIREVQKTLAQSAKRLIEDKIAAMGLSRSFDIQREQINTPGGGVIIFHGMQDHTAESIKSLEGFQRAWIEEAQTLSTRSLTLLRPTLRVEGSEIWASWNPRRKSDAIDEFLRLNKPDNAVVVRANWRDNPWFPSVLETERRLDLERYPDRYEHIWEGDYARALEGAYFAKQLSEARLQGRIGHVAPDPLLPIKAVFDLGGSGANADAMAIWVTQWVGQTIKVLDYIEGVGQVLAYYVNELRNRGYAHALCILPHDGVNANNITGKRYEDHVRDAGFQVKVIKNQGRGAAMMRVEAARRLFPRVWFNEATTEAGRDALGYYHERKDEGRGVGLGPEHDWSCFTGETKVLTRLGKQRIMDLTADGEVLTPCGWKQYRRLGITGRSAPLVEVTFSDGYSVKSTPEHLFLTASGWKSAEHLTPHTLIQSSLTPSRSISMAASTAYGLAKTTTRAVVENCTGMLGQWLSAPSPQAATSTIGTATQPTTLSKTLSAFLPPNTCPFPGAITLPTGRSTSHRKPAPQLRSGTSPKRGGFGIVAMLSGRRAGPSGAGKTDHAITARPCLAPWSARAGGRNASAPVYAKPLRITSVRRLPETADVWCIEVPDGAWFALENGAVVHNSHAADAFGLLCVAYEEPRYAEEDEHRPEDRTRSLTTGY